MNHQSGVEWLRPFWILALLAALAGYLRLGLAGRLPPRISVPNVGLVALMLAMVIVGHRWTAGVALVGVAVFAAAAAICLWLLAIRWLRRRRSDATMIAAAVEMLAMLYMFGTSFWTAWWIAAPLALALGARAVWWALPVPVRAGTTAPDGLSGPNWTIRWASIAMCLSMAWMIAAG